MLFLLPLGDGIETNPHNLTSARRRLRVKLLHADRTDFVLTGAGDAVAGVVGQ